MVDGRYLIITLVAVFLSLALGLFIGANLPADQGLWAHQQALITALEREFQLLRGENQSLARRVHGVEHQLTSERQLSQALLVPLYRGQLSGRRLHIWELGASPLREELVDWLLESGAQVRAGPPGSEVSGPGLEPADCLILLVGDGQQLQPHEPLIRQLQATGVRLICISSGYTEEQVSQTCQSWGIPQVTHADTPAGRLSLLYLVEGREPTGSFGWQADQVPWPHPAFLYAEGYHD